MKLYSWLYNLDSLANYGSGSAYALAPDLDTAVELICQVYYDRNQDNIDEDLARTDVKGEFETDWWWDYCATDTLQALYLELYSTPPVITDTTWGTFIPGSD